MNAAEYQREKQAAAQGLNGRRQGVATVPAASQTATAPAAPQKGTSLPLMSLAQQVSLIGNDQSLQPPDTQLAAGPSSLVEFDNSAGSIWTKSGTLSSYFDLNTFFGVVAQFSFSDPRIVFDTISGRWVASGLSFDSSNDSKTYLAVSASSDPTGTWKVYTLSNATAVLEDQPFLGVSADKIVVSWNDYDVSQNFAGVVTDVVQKSDALSGSTITPSVFGPDANRFRLVPAQSLTRTTTEWLTYNNADCAGGTSATCNKGVPTLGVVAITGTPAGNNVVWTEYDPSIAPMSMPPNPHQPGGSNDSQIDDRLLGATWQNGQLWTTATDACTPGGGPTRDCLRLDQLSAPAGGATPAVSQDIDFGSTSLDLYYPAATPDVVGDVFVSYSDSSSTLNPQAAALEQRAGSPGTVDGSVVIESGASAYNGGASPRWGDYSAVAEDPANPTTVWPAAEYVASGGAWGTATAPLSVVQPNGGQYSSVTPYGTQLHDFYYDNVAHVLRHSWWNGIAWGSEVLDGAGGGNGRVNEDVGQHDSAIVYNGQLQDFYYDAAAHVLRHAWWNGLAWSFETLDGAGGPNGQVSRDVGQYNSTILYNGQLQDFYYDATVHQLRHSWWNGLAWSAEPLDGAGGGTGQTTEDVGQYNSAILYNGQLQDFYYDATAHALRHSWWNGLAWSAEPLDGIGGGTGQVTEDVGQYSSSIVYNGQLQDFYYDAASHVLRHGWWNGAGWFFETLDGAGGGNGRAADDVGQYNDTVLYNGQLQDFDADSFGHLLRHAWWTGADWFFEWLL